MVLTYKQRFYFKEVEAYRFSGSKFCIYKKILIVVNVIYSSEPPFNSNALPSASTSVVQYKIFLASKRSFISKTFNTKH